MTKPLAIAVILTVSLFGGEAQAIRSVPPDRIEAYRQNIRAGFAAKTGFELVAPRVPGHNEKETKEYWREITYPLYLHTATTQSWIHESALNSIQWATLAWKTPDAYPFIFDLYLHGKPDSDSLAIYIPNMDIRKFLHPSIAPLAYERGSDQFLRLAQIQAYFAEFSRNGKILYPLPSEHQKNSITEKERMEQSTPIAHRSNIAQRIASVTITNNCREPGLYEAAIRDGNDRTLWRAAFSFHTKLYNQILTQYHGMGISEQGTGIRVSKEIRKLNRMLYWDSYLPWKWLKSFPKVKIDALSVLSTQEHSTALPPSFAGTIDVAKGEIPFEEYRVETQRKSEFHYPGGEPLSYLRVNPDLPPPMGFEPTMERFWTIIAGTLGLNRCLLSVLTQHRIRFV